MKSRLLLLILLVAGGAAAAQTTRSQAAPNLLLGQLAATPAAPDTVAAVHQLFAAKRKRNSHFFVGTLGVATLGGVIIGTAPSTWKGLDQAVLGVAIIGLVSLPALVAEVVVALDYNKKNELRAVEDFQTHKLPRYLKRKLRPKYFQGASVQ